MLILVYRAPERIALQLIEPVVLDVGRVDGNGLIAHDGKAVGTPVFVMIKACDDTFSHNT